MAGEAAASGGQAARINLSLLKTTWAAFGEDKALRLAAAIAYSALFSIAPLFIVVIAIVGWVIGVQNGGHGHHVAEDALLAPIRHAAGAPTADAVRGIITASFDKPRQSVVAQIFGWVAFIGGATALFSSLQDALNTVWHVEAIRGGWKQLLRARATSFGMILVVGFLLLVSLLGNVAIDFVGTHVLARLPIIGSPTFLAALTEVTTAAIAMVMFAAMFKVLPDVEIAWGDVWFGAAATAVLFALGEAALAVYFRFAGIASGYGAAGSLLVAILWIYYSAALLLLGAEFTKVRAGTAKTTAPAELRSLTEHPAGVDPRVAGKATS
ncbi:MAG TPA: YihY/virulence factor BrkB family protein [Candidatus Acidoferrales bacterium]|nr:YihY/virulence factor BrkB family protein [Candidatus Acidoferrales bacterium]